MYIEIYNQTVNIGFIVIGIYYMYYYKLEAKKSLLRSPKYINIGNKKYNIQKEPIIKYLFPYFYLLLGLFFFLTGVLTLFNIIKFR